MGLGVFTTPLAEASDVITLKRPVAKHDAGCVVEVLVDAVAAFLTCTYVPYQFSKLSFLSGLAHK
jgi:hypothetical protein